MVMVSNHSGTEVGYLAGRYPGALGHLYSPGGQRGPYPFIPYALDNGVFPVWEKAQRALEAGGAEATVPTWDVPAWRELLRWAAWSMQPPLWALVPDSVGNAGETRRRWGLYLPEVRAAGFRPAFAVQDGATFDDVPGDCVLFLGGSTDWKLDAIEPWCRRFPGRVHVGRVNTAERLIRCYRAGAVSVDGTGWFAKNTRVRSGGGGGGQRAQLVKFIEETHGKARAAA